MHLLLRRLLLFGVPSLVLVYFLTRSLTSLLDVLSFWVPFLPAELISWCSQALVVNGELGVILGKWYFNTNFWFKDHDCSSQTGGIHIWSHIGDYHITYLFRLFQ